MSQETIIKWLRAHKGKKYSAPQLMLYLKINMSIYSNLRKLRKDINKGNYKDLKYVIVSYGGVDKAFKYWSNDTKDLS